MNCTTCSFREYLKRPNVKDQLITAGMDGSQERNCYSPAFVAKCHAYHREGEQWSEIDLSDFFRKGLFQFYFQRMLLVQSHAVEVPLQMNLALHAQTVPRKEFFCARLLLIFSRIFGKQMKSLRPLESCLSNPEIPPNVREQLDSVKSIAAHVARDSSLSQLGAIFQRAKRFEELKQDKLIDNLLSPILPLQPTSAQSIDQVQFLIAFRVNQYVQELIGLISKQRVHSVKHLAQAVKQYDWTALLTQDIPTVLRLYQEEMNDSSCKVTE